MEKKTDSTGLRGRLIDDNICMGSQTYFGLFACRFYTENEIEQIKERLCKLLENIYFCFRIYNKILDGDWLFALLLFT